MWQVRTDQMERGQMLSKYVVLGVLATGLATGPELREWRRRWCLGVRKFSRQGGEGGADFDRGGPAWRGQPSRNLGSKGVFWA